MAERRLPINVERTARSCQAYKGGGEQNIIRLAGPWPDAKVLTEYGLLHGGRRMGHHSQPVTSGGGRPDSTRLSPSEGGPRSGNAAFVAPPSLGTFGARIHVGPRNRWDYEWRGWPVGEPTATAPESGSSASVGVEITDATRRGSRRLLTGCFTAGSGWAAGRSSIPGWRRALLDLLHLDEW